MTMMTVSRVWFRRIAGRGYAPYAELIIAITIILITGNFLEIPEMSAKKRKEAPMPASGAGLLRFFEEESKGIKVRPEIVIGLSAALIAVVTILRALAPV